MKAHSKKIIIAALILAGIAGLTQIIRSSDEKSSGNVNSLVATIYQSPTCGCCSVFAKYMERRNYGVDVQYRGDVVSVKNDLNIPQELYSCHTMEVDGYVVEGHIPEEAVQKLLTERPDIKGIGMAGMPAGSPGMPGPKTEDFVIYEITHNGEVGEVFLTI